MDRRVFGNDANPMSIMMTRPRLHTPELCDIEFRLNAVPWDSGEPTSGDKRFGVFFHSATLRQIVALRDLG